MANITTRQTAGTGATVKGSPLTNAEVDTNFINLNTDLSTAVYTTGSYSNPSWITSLNETKVLPTQTGNSGKYLTTNGTNTSWDTIKKQGFTFNVKDYGAFGDFETNPSCDDTAAINSAIAAAVASGGTVFFPSGVYRITGPLNLTIDALDPSALGQRPHLLGEGIGASVIYQAGASNGLNISSSSASMPNSYVTVSGLSFVGGSGTLTAINVSASAYLTIRDCQITGWTTGIYGSDILSTLIEKCVITFNTNGFRFEREVTGYASNPNSITLLQCNIGANTNYGGWVVGAGTFTVVGGTFENNGSGTDLSTSKWGLRITNAGGVGGQESSVGFVLNGVYFEGNGGRAHLYIEQTVNRPGLTGLVSGCSFVQFGTSYANYYVSLEADQLANSYPVTFNACGFSGLNAYTASIARPTINNLSDYYTVSLLGCNFWSATDQYKQGIPNRLEGILEVPTIRDLSGANALTTVKDKAESWYYNKLFTIQSGDGTNPNDLFFKSDGTSMYIVDTTVGYINEYTLSTPWDVTTSSTNWVNRLSTGSTSILGIFFSSDGTNLYTSDYTTDLITWYTLSTPWTLSSATSSGTFSTVGQDTFPHAMQLSADGTKLYIMGQTNRTIYQYNLGTAWNITTAVYSQSYSINPYLNNCLGMTFNSTGTKLWVSGWDFSGSLVFEFNLSTAWDISTISVGSYRGITYIPVSIDATGFWRNTWPTGIYVNNTLNKAWILSWNNRQVIEYSTDLTGYKITGNSLILGVPYVQINGDLEIKNNLQVNGWIDTEEIILEGIYIGSGSITTIKDSVESWYTTGGSAYIGGTEGLANDLFFNTAGTKMYVLGRDTYKVYEYTLGTAWQEWTLTLNYTLTLAQEQAQRGMYFSPDGTNLYIVGSTSNTVYQYSLSTPWLLSSTTYTGKFISVTTEETSCQTLSFKSDGTKLYIAGRDSDKIHEYNLSTAWDVSTAVLFQSSSLINTYLNIAGYIVAISFNSTGTKLWATDINSYNKVMQFSLSTPWDITTLSFGSHRPLRYYTTSTYTDILSFSGGIFVNEEQGRAWIVDNTNDRLFSYYTDRDAHKIFSSNNLILSVSDVIVNNDLYVKRNTFIGGKLYVDGDISINTGNAIYSVYYYSSDATTSVYLGNNLTTGSLFLGGTSGTGTITLGRSTVSQTVGLATGITSTGNTKTVNIGTGGASGSTTTITIGSTTGTSTVTINGSLSVTGKFIDRIVAYSTGTTLTINGDTTDIATYTNTEVAGTLTVSAPTGTPVNGQKLLIRMQSTNIQTFSWNAIFQGSNDIGLPTTSTGSSKYDYIGFIYNSTAAKWQLLSTVFGF